MVRGAGAAARIAGFVAHLRRHGFALGPGETETALSLLAADELPNPPAARLALKILLSGKREEWARFDPLFDSYWFGRDTGIVERGAAAGGRATRPAIWNGVPPSDAAAPASSSAERTIRPEEAPRGAAGGRFVASPSETRAHTDLRRFSTPEEIAEAERIAERLARAIRCRLIRRHRPARRGDAIDLRRTVRRNLARGGEPIELRHRQRPKRPVKLVVLLDVSGSMQLYSRFYLAFLRGLIGAWLRADAFLFHTRLLRISDALREADPHRALARLSLIAKGFGGGTRIAASLKAFNDRYAGEALGSRAVVIVISDGYDTDPPAALAIELARLKRRARRMVWLNPLIGWKNYAPVARAMAVALDYVDCFAPAHSLASLAALEGELARL
jgi:uncharacterized protein with von Willebrand factor type A (vWA) domain